MATGGIGLGLTLSLVGGCGKAEAPQAFVTGTVMMDGTPLDGARLVFAPESGVYCGAVTDDAGHYELLAKSGTPGVPPGKYAVSISTDLNGTHTPGAERVPPKYNSYSTLSAEVEAGTNERNFDLKTTR